MALVLYFFPSQENVFVFGLSVIIIVSLIFDMLRLTFSHINDFVFEKLHFLFVERDRQKINSAIFYFMGCLLTISIFHYDIAAIGILYLSFGDTAAAIGGMSLGKKIPLKIPGTTKTFIGSFTFVVVAFIIGLLLKLPLPVALYSAIAGSIIEALPLGIDDNFTIPFFSSLTIFFLI